MAPVPALPGATNSWGRRGLCASFQRMAGSRAPLPMTRTLMEASLELLGLELLSAEPETDGRKTEKTGGTPLARQGAIGYRDGA